MDSHEGSRSKPVWIFLVALLAIVAIAAYRPSGIDTSETIGSLPQVETVTYTYVDQTETFKPVEVKVHPVDEQERKKLTSMLAQCLVFPQNIVPITPEDSALLNTIKPYTDKDNVIPHKDLKSGVVQKVRVLLEKTFRDMAQAGQFKIILKNPPMRVAMGQEFEIEIGTEGAVPKQVVEIQSSIGKVARKEDGSGFVLRGRIDAPGAALLSVWGRDNRGLGVRSNAPKVDHSIEALGPLPSAPQPTAAFINETFALNLAVRGYENTSAYSWRMLLDGAVVKEGTGTMVEWAVPDNALGKKLVVNALYKGKPYQRAIDTTGSGLRSSDYEYAVLAPSERIGGESFVNNGEYNLSQTFQFFVVRCGRCVSSNYRAIDANNIKVIVEMNGREILDGDPDINPTKGDPNQPGRSSVTFRLDRRLKIRKDGEQATITIRAGNAPTKVVNVTIFPDGN